MASCPLLAVRDRIKAGEAVAAGIADEIGAIEVGKIADLALLDTNPLRDIANIQKINRVIARGKLIDRDSLPEQPIFYLPE